MFNKAVCCFRGHRVVITVSLRGPAVLRCVRCGRTLTSTELLEAVDR